MTLQLLVYMLVMVNPFAQVLYVWELLRRLRRREFAAAYWRASLLSFGVFVFFALTGDFLFEEVFQVRLDAFRIFGGVVILLVAYRSLREGTGSSFMMGSDVKDLAPQISLPFMVGPGTIWVSIRIGREMGPLLGPAGLAAVLLVNCLFVVTMHRFIHHLEAYQETLMGQYFNLLMRTNSLFVGAIAVEMILSGIEGAMKTRSFLP